MHSLNKSARAFVKPMLTKATLTKPLVLCAQQSCASKWKGYKSVAFVCLQTRCLAQQSCAAACCTAYGCATAAYKPYGLHSFAVQPPAYKPYGFVRRSLTKAKLLCARGLYATPANPRCCYATSRVCLARSLRDPICDLAAANRRFATLRLLRFALQNRRFCTQPNVVRLLAQLR